MRLVVVVGRPWPLSSGLGRPEDGPAWQVRGGAISGGLPPNRSTFS